MIMVRKLFTQSPEHLKGPILVPLAIAMTLLLAVSLGVATWIQQLHIRKGVESHLSGVKQLFAGMQNDEANLMSCMLDMYEKNNALKEAFLAKDRGALLKAAEPIFRKINAKNDVTHFYFIDTDRTCFLRVHNPESYGDIIARYTLDEAVATQKTSYGTELGPYGTLTLRVVRPWVINGEIIGYIELGKEIEHIIRDIKKILDVEVLVIVNIRHLDRKHWEEGLKMLGRTGVWEEFPRHVVIDRTMEKIPPALEHYISLPHSEKEGLLFKVPVGEKEYRGGFIPLRVAGDKEIGEIIFLKDFSAAEYSLKLLSLGLVAISGIMSLALFVFFYITIDRIEGKLRGSRESLNAEIAERIKAEEKIKSSLQEKELLLREIHHRVKNNMQIVSSLFRLQLRQIDNPKVLEILQDSQSRISAMALVHEALYKQNLAGVNFRDYIRELGLNLFSSYGVDPERIEFVTDVEKITMDIDTAIPCGLIINELVTNALKHAFPDGREGKVWLTLKRNAGGKEFHLTVRDDGVGIPEEVDIYSTKSLGMQLVVNLTESQLHGKVQVNRNHGTEIEIIFNETQYAQRV